MMLLRKKRTRMKTVFSATRIMGSTLALVMFTGCNPFAKSIPPAAERALQESPQLTLLSLDPNREMPGARKMEGSTVLGELQLSPESRERVVQALRTDISHYYGRSALCFLPRHAIKATTGGTTYYFLVCYECGNMKIFANDELLTQIGVSGSGKIFNEVLSAGNVPLAALEEKY